MDLTHALRIQPAQSVAFTGAGGKTTAIRKLALELGKRELVLVTTTTKIWGHQNDLAAFHIDSPQDFSLLEPLLEEHGSVLVTAGLIEDEGKWKGLSEDGITALHRLAQSMGAFLLIEADGARGRSLKAPAPYEPVVPEWVDLVVPMAGMDVLGEALDSTLIHRPERVARILSGLGDEPLTPRSIAKILCSPQGGLQSIPGDACVRTLLNKVEGQERKLYASEIARHILKERRVQSVILAAVQNEAPVSEVHARTAGVVLAAGRSTRFAGRKQLLEWHGKPLVRYAAEAACRAGLAPVVVVMGEGDHALRDALGDLPLEFVVNENPDAGQGHSLKLGVGALPGDVDAAVLCLADMPLVDEKVIQALLAAHQSSLAPIVAPHAQGRYGNPVLFDRSTFDLLKDICGDRGGRVLFDRLPPLAVPWDDAVLFDVDTKADWERLQGME